MNAPAPARPFGFEAGQLWSLWEIMSEIDFAAILEGMILFSKFFQKWDMERALRQPFAKEQLDHCIAAAEKMHLALSNSGLNIAAKHASAFLGELKNATVNGDDCVLDGIVLQKAYHYLSKLLSVTSDEAGSKIFINIDYKNISLYEQKDPPMGEPVENAFVAASYDISEAAKCLALGRPTATVFHLMRSAEIAVSIVGDKLGATVLDQHGQSLPWGIIVANIKQKIDSMTKGAHQDECYKIHALLHSVNRSFRTKTAHPAATYTQKEAENAFNLTKAFMQEMASFAL